MPHTILFCSLATPLLPPASGAPEYLSLASLVAATLDDSQRATRDALAIDPCPPSGRGSDRETVRVR